MDKETYDIVSEEKKIENFVKTEEWGIIKEKWANAILDLQSIRNVKLTDPQQVAIEIQARNLAIDILMSWMQDIEGTAEKSKNSNIEIKRTSYIWREQ